MMNLEPILSNLNEVSKLLEASYKLMSKKPTSSDLETTVKDKLLVNIKNTLVQNVINFDMTNEINEHPGDETTLEAILDLISDSEEILS